VRKGREKMKNFNRKEEKKYFNTIFCLFSGLMATAALQVIVRDFLSNVVLESFRSHAFFTTTVTLSFISFLSISKCGSESI
jgi:hypothetical protein